MLDNSILIPKRAIYNLLGSLCKQPQLIFDEEISTLDGEDFGEKFFKVIYGAVNNIIVGNANIKSISAVDVDNYLAPMTSAFKIYSENGGLEYLTSAIENANVDLVKQNFDWIKKFALLREFNSSGFDITDIYNPTNIDLEATNQQMEKLRKMPLDDISKHFNLKLLQITNKWDITSTHKSYNINEGIDNLLDSLNEKPVYGYPFANLYYNSIFRGMQFGKLFLRSAGTGGNKTRTALTDMVMVGCEEIFDMDKMKYVKTGDSMPCTFISTEIDLRQIQTTMLAIVSGIQENVIKDGRYSEDILKRLKHGIEIIKKAPIHLHYLPEYDIQDISQIIEKDVLQYGVKFVWHDYIMYNGKLAKTTSGDYGTNGLREDLVLVNFSAQLKQLAEKYNVFIATSTQLNRSAKEHENRDTNAIRGSSAIVDKVDMATLMFRASEKDISKLEHILRIPGMLKPNFCHYVFKNREGESNIIVWTIRNMGNMRETACFCTNLDYELLDHIHPLDLVVSNEPETTDTDSIINSIFS